MTRILIWGLLTLAVIAQLYIPGNMVYVYERTLNEGEAVKFRIGMYDPYDPFRGRYVQLRYEVEERRQRSEWNVPESISTSWEQSYVSFETDEEGFAKIVSISDVRPDSGLYLKLKVRTYGDWVHVEMPFDRYFMNEKSAPEAEKIFNEIQRTQRPISWGGRAGWRSEHYAVVRMYKGQAVLESLYLAGRPVEELVKEPTLWKEYLEQYQEEHSSEEPAERTPIEQLADEVKPENENPGEPASASESNTEL